MEKDRFFGEFDLFNEQIQGVNSKDFRAEQYPAKPGSQVGQVVPKIR